MHLIIIFFYIHLKLFVSYFRGLIERDLVITIELKNGLELKGRLAFVDKNMNFHLNNVEVEDMTKFPHFVKLNFNLY